MKKFLAPLFLTSLLFSFQSKHQIDLRAINYENFNNELFLVGSSKFSKEADLSIEIDIEYFYSSEYESRREVLLKEAFIEKEFDEVSFQFGKMVKHWGELEGFNIVDVFNSKNYLLDPFEQKEKYGSYALWLSKNFEESSLEFGAKLLEENQKLPKKDDPYYPFLMNYSEDLKTEKSETEPTLYLKYNFTYEESFESENSLVFINGYDNKRGVTPKDLTTLQQYSYRANKALWFFNGIYEEYIFKGELSYTDVLDYKNISDYYQLAFGIERSFYDLDGKDLTLFSEFYKYNYKEKLQENIDTSEIYDNDLFVGAKFNFNDTRDSEIKGGVFIDLKNSEDLMKVEGKTRVADGYVLYFEYLDLNLKQVNSKKRTIIGIEGTF